MKKRSGFFITMAVLFILLFVLQIQLPKPFVWQPSYNHLDRQPFGCYVFDSVLKVSLPKGYHVTRLTSYQLDKQYKNQQIAVLAQIDFSPASVLDIAHLENIAKRGGKVMIVSSYEFVNDSLDTKKYVSSRVVFSGSNYFSLRFVTRAIKERDSLLYDTLYWRKYDTAYSARPFKMYRELLSGSVRVDSIPHQVLSYHMMMETYEPEEDSLYVGEHTLDSVELDKGGYMVHEYAMEKVPTAVVVPCGKGEMIYACCPLLFTNYGILDPEISTYLFRLMSQMSDLPVYRTEAYLSKNQVPGVNDSPFREFLKRPPLRWALYLAMIGILLFVIFSARRRQRVIPVMAKPGNKSLEFVKLIGTLYYQRHDNRDLVEKKFRYFAEEVRRKIGVDVGDVNHDDEECQNLASRTGMDFQKVRECIRQVRLVIHLEGNITTEQMRLLIDEMDAILERL